MIIKKYSFDYKKYEEVLAQIFLEIEKQDQVPWKVFRRILARYPKDGNSIFSKSDLVAGLRGFIKKGRYTKLEGDDILRKIRMKPVRTQSGVTTVTVLTKPFPCPGKCIFCPNDVRMPKSYLSDEPGAQRAERNNFEPYLQVYNRLQALHNIGHPTGKIELIILGGTWSYYPLKYQIFFIKECFRALNDYGSGIDSRKEIESKSSTYSKEDLQSIKEMDLESDDYNYIVGKIAKSKKSHASRKKTEDLWEELYSEHKKNEGGNSRCVGLTIETRPDNISKEEVIRLRRLGATKTQIGFQSLSDHVLDINKRGHSVRDTIEAVKLLRMGGFKIHAHWMANLYGSDLENDKEDYKKMFDDVNFRPDELKIYPCALISSAELVSYHKRGIWKPYSEEEVYSLVEFVILHTPEYCRLTRIIREFSAKDIVVGNKKTNLRQVVESNLDNKKIERRDIRSREVGGDRFEFEKLKFNTKRYKSSAGIEHFLQFVTSDNKIVGFLRLLFPYCNGDNLFIDELKGGAIIREVHVYGRVVNVGMSGSGKPQHMGIGKELIRIAEEQAKENNFSKISVISSVGTRKYYRDRGFQDGELYQYKEL